MDDQHALATVTFEALTESRATTLAEHSLGSLEDAPRLKGAIETVLAPILNVAPDAAMAIAQRGKHLVEFSAEGSAALGNGALSFLQRRDGRLQPTLVNQARHFKENAVLVGPAAQRVVAAAAVAHVVILLAVQAQIVSMEQSLARIEKKLDALGRRLDQEKLALVRGRLRALRKLRDELASAEWTGEDQLRWKVALDQADTEFHQVEELARLQCADAAADIRSARMNVVLFGSPGSKLVAEIHEHIERFRQHEELLLLCLLGRFVVAHLRSGLGGHIAVDELLRDVEQALSASIDHETLVLDKVMEFTTKFRNANFEIETRKRLRDGAHMVRKCAEKTIGTLRDQLGTLSGAQPQRVRVVVDVADGGVKEVLLVDEAHASSALPGRS